MSATVQGAEPVRLPFRYTIVNYDLKWDKPLFFRYPLRSEVQAAGGFVPYSQSQVFADSIKKEVFDWQYNAYVWNQDPDASPRHEESTILNPQIEVHLLDPEDGGPVIVKLPRWPFPPPEPPSKVTAKLQPQPPAPGLGNVLGDIKKIKPPER